MLSFFRAFSKSWFGPLIFGLLLIAFGVLGSGSVRSVINPQNSTDVVVAGDHSVSSGQFQSMFQRTEQDYQKQSGQPYPLEDAIRQGADKSILQELAAQSSYAEMLNRLGIAPPDSVIDQELKRQAVSGDAPGFAQLFDSVTGKFDPKALQALLANNGLTEAEFRRELADGVADDEVRSAISTGFSPPRIYAAVQAALLLQSRDVTYFVIPAASIPVPPKPTDAQLTALMQQFKSRLMLPERRTFTLVQFSAKALAPTMPVDPAQVEQQFEAKKDKYGKPETRSLSEIPLNDPKSAPQVQAALAKGLDPQSVAKAVGSQAIVYQDQPAAAVVDRKAAAAAFQMTTGQISGPVQGDFKLVILQVTKITPAQAPDVNAAKGQIEADLKQAEAVDKVYDLYQKYQDERQSGLNMADAAKKLGLTTVQIGPVSADGKDLTGAPANPLLTPKLLATAFHTGANSYSDVQQDADQGEYFDVHVDQVLPPALPGLDEKGVRPVLTQAYFQQTIVGGLQAKGAEAVAALKKGQTFEAVAPTYHAQVAHQVGIQQITAQQYQQTLGQAFLSAVFDAKAGEVFSAGSDPLKGFVIARVDQIRPGDPNMMSKGIEALRQRGGQTYVQGLQSAMRDAAVKMIKPHTNMDLAHQIMGVDAAMLARAAKPATAGSAPTS